MVTEKQLFQLTLRLDESHFDVYEHINAQRDGKFASERRSAMRDYVVKLVRADMKKSKK